MKNRLVVEQARVKEFLSYDEMTGVFTNRVTRGHLKVGTLAGCLRADGYRVIRLNNQLFLAHRLAWLYAHGVMPSADIDHINGDRADNRLANLRSATCTENMRNGRPRKSISGLKGVSWKTNRKAWAGQIHKDGRCLHLGHFATPEEAHAAYVKAATELFGEFARIA